MGTLVTQIDENLIELFVQLLKAKVLIDLVRDVDWIKGDHLEQLCQENVCYCWYNYGHQH